MAAAFPNYLDSRSSPVSTARRCDLCSKQAQGGPFSTIYLRTLPCRHSACLQCYESAVKLGCPVCMKSQVYSPPITTSSSSSGLSAGYLPHSQDTSIVDTSMLLGNLLNLVHSYPDTPVSATNGNTILPFGNLENFGLASNRFDRTIKQPSLTSLSGSIRCTACSEGYEATGQCQDCNEYLCASCIQAHIRVRVTKDHRIAQVFNASLGSSAAGHTPIGSVTPTQQDTNIRSRHTTATTALSGEFRALLRNFEDGAEAVDRMSERIDARTTAIANEIKASIYHHISALEERRRETLAQVEAVRNLKLTTLSQQRDQLKALLTQMREVQRVVDLLIHSGTEADLNNARQILAEHVGQLKMVRPQLATPQENDSVIFNTPDPGILTAIRKLGTVVTGAFGPNCLIIGDAYRRTVKGKRTVFTIQMKDHLGENCTQGGEQVQVLIRAPSDNVSAANVQDVQNGQYVVTYEPASEGDHVIRITLRGVPICNSPFLVDVRKGRDYTTVGPRPLFSFGHEGTEDGQLCRPWGICCDHQGRLLIADRSNNRVQVFNMDGQFLMKFGTKGNRNGQFDRPAGICVNSENQIIVADKDNHRIQVFLSDGQFLTKFGEKGRGSGQFSYPWDVAINTKDQVAVSDTRNHRVQMFDKQGNFLMKFGFETSLFLKQFDSPRGVVFAPSDHLLVTDFNNHRLVIIDTNTGEMKYIGREGDTDGQFRRPQGIDIDLEGYIFIADSRNNRVQVYSPSATYLCAFGVEGVPPRMRSVMDRPCDVCVSPEGRIFVVDFGNNQIHAF